MNAAGPGRPTDKVDPALFALHNGSRYRTPIELQVTRGQSARFLVLGGCLAQAVPEIAAMIDRAWQGDFILVDNLGTSPAIPSSLAAQYDFQIIHIPLRTILGSEYFQLPDDTGRHEAFLRATEDRLARYLAGVLKLNTERKLLTFVMGFMVPQQNPLGRFQPRYDLRNVMHFIERLNMFLAAEVARLENAYFVDVDQISACIGKKACQDDAVWSFTHGTTLSDGDHDHDLYRIEAPASMQHHYSARWLEFFESLLHEIFAMHRTLRRSDLVKLVAVDLDDTLWRGVAAEGTLGVLEGWPMGFIEALLILKKRGVLLAIVSKNDEQFIRSNWESLVQGRIALSDFAAIKINFRSKAENLSDILREVNLLPRNTVMIDDNPAERAAVLAELPGVRVLGSHPYYLKRVLLWSAETQQPSITRESGFKTEMVRAQIRRESARQSLSHQEFLETLRLRVSVSAVFSTRDLHMNRALELFNKTQQFNTTGRRYTLEECHRRFADRCEMYVIYAEDRFTQYGLIGAAWVVQNCVDHIVMSCRALGLGIEDAFLAWLSNRLGAANMTQMLGNLQSTDLNAACREFYSRNGFALSAENPTVWSRSLASPLPIPPHVSLSIFDRDEVRCESIARDRRDAQRHFAEAAAATPDVAMQVG